MDLNRRLGATVALGWISVLRLESFANCIRAYILICVRFDDLLSIDRYALYANPPFAQ